jgi:hypothetical protein
VVVSMEEEEGGGGAVRGLYTLYRQLDAAAEPFRAFTNGCVVAWLRVWEFT